MPRYADINTDGCKIESLYGIADFTALAELKGLSNVWAAQIGSRGNIRFVNPNSLINSELPGLSEWLGSRKESLLCTGYSLAEFLIANAYNVGRDVLICMRHQRICQGHDRSKCPPLEPMHYRYTPRHVVQQRFETSGAKDSLILSHKLLSSEEFAIIESFFSFMPDYVNSHKPEEIEYKLVDYSLEFLEAMMMICSEISCRIERVLTFVDCAYSISNFSITSRVTHQDPTNPASSQNENDTGEILVSLGNLMMQGKKRLEPIFYTSDECRTIYNKFVWSKYGSAKKTAKSKKN